MTTPTVRDFRLRVYLVLCALLCWLAPGAWARGDYDEVLGDLEVEVSYDWPGALTHGYFPIHLSLRNTGAKELEFEVEAVRYYERDEFTKTLRLAAGERLDYDLVVRAGQRSNEYTLRFDFDRGHNLRPGFGPDAWSPNRNTVAVQVFSSGRGVATSLPNAAARLDSDGNVVLGLADPVRMPLNYLAYTSLDFALVDTVDGLPSGERLDALLAWVRLGGRVVFYGPEPGVLLERRPEWAAWAQERFAREHVEDDPAVRRWSVGHGELILLQDHSPLSGVSSLRRLRLLVGVDVYEPAWAPSPHGSRMSDVAVVQLFEQLPLRTMTLLLVIFAIVIGPVNFLFIRRWKRPLYLLVTVPGLALVWSLALLGYGIFYQGLDVKSVSHSWTVLDQRAKLSSTAEVRSFFAGSTPGPGLRLGPGTGCFDELGVTQFPDNTSTGHRADYSDGVLLSGAYLPVRTGVRHVYLVDRPARQRLGVTETASGVRVENALGATIEELILRDSSGRWCRRAGALAEGEAWDLEAASQPSDTRLAQSTLSKIWNMTAAELPAGAYVAQLSTSPFLDDCGIDLNEKAASHHVFGVLELGGEDR